MTERFRELHQTGNFIIPNPWDVGSARILEHLGFSALATTSSGFAASLGLPDMSVTRDQLVRHVTAITASVSIPVNVDAERCFSADAEGVAETIRLLGEAGASGISIEDYDPSLDRIDPVEVAVARVEVAAAECVRHGIVLTARAENLIHGISDLDDTIARLQAYRDVGAEVVYAPGLAVIDDVARVVREVAVPVNVLARSGGPSVGELAAVGVRRVSTGGSLAWVAYGALEIAARELQADGTTAFLQRTITRATRDGAFRR